MTIFSHNLSGTGSHVLGQYSNVILYAGDLLSVSIGHHSLALNYSKH